MLVVKTPTSKASFRLNSTRKWKAKKMTFERALLVTKVNYSGTNSEDNPKS